MSPFANLAAQATEQAPGLRKRVLAVVNNEADEWDPSLRLLIQEHLESPVVHERIDHNARDASLSPITALTNNSFRHFVLGRAVVVALAARDPGDLASQSFTTRTVLDPMITTSIGHEIFCQLDCATSTPCDRTQVLVSGN